MCNSNVVRSYYACYGFGGAPYVRCSGVRVVRAVVWSDVNVAFDEVCVVVVLSKKSVKVLDFIGQTVV